MDKEEGVGILCCYCSRRGSKGGWWSALLAGHMQILREEIAFIGCGLVEVAHTIRERGGGEDCDYFADVMKKLITYHLYLVG